MSPHQQIGNPTGPPYPAYSIHPASSAYDSSSSSVDIRGVRSSASLSNTWVTPKAGSSKGPMIRHTASTNQQPVLGKKWRTTTIETLPEDTLLEIFDFYRLGAMDRGLWNWLRLSHVCKRWRHIISMSPRRLDLRILCTSGAAIKSTLDSWPTLPLVISYGWRRRLKHIPRNVIDALRHPDRLCKIDLNVTSSMTGPIVKAIQKPCQVLEDIHITINDTQGPSILVRNAFLGGSAPHLRKIELDGIAFPFSAIRQVLLSPTTSSSFTFRRSRMTFIFHPMTSFLLCPPWSNSNG
ncbi:hypothetical protein BJV77DRAFT_560521 [Russula vinacea]|nr:hypothetical protein BJV77DRAFT_560521 [Russula vinacea]